MVAILRLVLALRRPVKVLNILWTRKNTFLGGLFVLLKLIRVNIDWFSSPTFTRAVVTYDPLSLYDHNTHTFKILNRSNMTFLIEPDPDQVCPSGKVLLLLSLSRLAKIFKISKIFKIFKISRLANREQRQALRKEMEKVNQSVGIVFLIAETSNKELQHQIEEEKNIFGDLLQVSIFFAFVKKKFSLIPRCQIRSPTKGFLLRHCLVSYGRVCAATVSSL